MELLRRESRNIISSFIIIIVCWLGWLCGLVFGQVAEAFTSAVNFPDVALTCLANLAVFFRCILLDKHSYETYAKNRKVVIRDEEERNINGLKVMTTCKENLQKCSVVMLSFHYPASLVAKKFLYSISHACDVHSSFLQCRSLECGDFSYCNCTENGDGRCGCIIFNAEQHITMMLARQLPGTVKRLADSLFLLPCNLCLSKGCHGCNQGLLYVEYDTLKESEPNREFPAAVCEILQSIPKVDACICIPVHPFYEDEWTNELIRVFEPQERELRGVVFREGGTNASSALENYKNGNGECDADETYSLASLAIVPHLAKALIMFVLTFLLKVDGFSSSMLANRSVSSYFSSKSRQIFPHEYLTRARVKSNANKTNLCQTNVCQVFFFRSAFQIVMLFFLSFGPQCICFFGWMLLVEMEGGAHTWYHIPSMALSEGRMIVIIVAIFIALAMDVFDLKLYLQIRRRNGFSLSFPSENITDKSRGLTVDRVNICLFCAMIGSQLFVMVRCISALLQYQRDIKAFGKWIYISLEWLVLVKWLTFNLILLNCQDALDQDSLEDGKPMWWYGTCGRYIGASAVLLNATLAGVRAQWKFSWDSDSISLRCTQHSGDNMYFQCNTQS